jgi:uncharacterized protein
MHVFYLHGFASSPESGKARFFQDRLAGHGVAVECPDFNEPAFETLSVTRMLDQLDAAIDARPPGPVVLIGSSLGGFVAWHAAGRRTAAVAQPRPVTHLVLLAPAFDFGVDRLFDPVLDEWRRAGVREVFHHARQRSMPIGFGLWEDAGRYDAAALDLRIPVLVFQGLRDDIVPPATARAFAARMPNVRLRLLDDDHRLQEHLPQMWEECAEFLGLDRS